MNLNIAGSAQDELLRAGKINAYQLMFWMNLFSAGFLGLWVLIPSNPELAQGFDKLNNPNKPTKKTACSTVDSHNILSTHCLRSHFIL